MKQNLKFLIAVITGAIILMADVFYNGYPLFTSDAHLYMMSGFEMRMLDDRSSAYGLFIRLFSLNGVSMYPVTFFQSLILSYLIFLTVKLFLGEKKFLLRGLSIILFLSLFTGLSWTASQILTDIFTPIIFLSLFIIVFGNPGRATRILLYVIFCIAVSMHLSHIVLFICVLFFIFFAKKWVLPGADRKKGLLNVAVLVVLTLLSVLPMRNALNNSKYVFLMGAMVEQGIARPYLDEYCGIKNYKICSYKDSLPASAGEFIFSPESPFAKIGGWKPEVEEEFKDIVDGTLTKPKYIGLHIKGSVKSTIKQLYNFDICDGNWAYSDSNGVVYSMILKYFNREAKAYYNSRQIRERFVGIDFIKMLFRIVEVLSLLLIIGLLIYYRGLFKGIFKTGAIMVFVMILFNDWDLATFACVTDRYGCKVAWLVPFLAIMLVIRLLDSRKPQSSL